MDDEQIAKLTDNIDAIATYTSRNADASDEIVDRLNKILKLLESIDSKV